MRGLPVDLRRVRQQHEKLTLGDVGARLLDIVDAIEMRVVDAGQMDLRRRRGSSVTFSLSSMRNAHVLELGDHADGIVVSEHAVDGPPSCARTRATPSSARRERPERLAAIITGQHADVIVETRQELDQPVHGRPAHVRVQVAEVQDGEAARRRRAAWARRWCSGRSCDPARVAAATTVEPGQPKRVPDDRMDGIPVLDVHEVQALPEQLRLVIVLDPQALAGMDGAEASLEPTHDFAILHALPFTPA